MYVHDSFSEFLAVLLGLILVFIGLALIGPYILGMLILFIGFKLIFNS